MTDLSQIDGNSPLILVGAGKMGSALIAGWLAQGAHPDGIIALRPSAEGQAALRSAHPGIRVAASLADLPEGLAPRVILFAVKPQKFAEVLPSYQALMGPGVLVISVAAGVALASMQRFLGAVPMVRAMPNTPAAVGAGMTALVGNAQAGEADRALAGRLLGAVGKAVWLEREAEMDAVTALSGSGPAYVFHMVEAMAAAGAAAGLSPSLAMALARQTVIGAGALLDASPDDAATLRRNVTSPGGTTQAALDILMQGDALSRLMTEAVAAAARRARELAG